MRIVSGGQTGVDRGALDAALEAGIPCGGWCPEGRQAEDGRIDDRYPLTELPGGGYPERTRQNVIDSDATLIIHFGSLSGGTALTVRYCEELGKPHLLVDAHRETPAEGATAVLDFLSVRKADTLNVAGPRASKAPAAAEYTRHLILQVAARMPR